MSTSANNSKNQPFFLRLHPWHRVVISSLVAMIGFVFINRINIKPILKVMYVWNIFSLTLLILYWIVIVIRPVDKIRDLARKEDGSLAYVFMIILLSAVSSMFTVLLLFISKDTENVNPFTYLFAAIPSLLLSWAIIHTAFAFHYAHIYYDDEEDNPKKHAEGLDFPNDKKPDYRDFAYFSFVIGMTFQVSDVEITSKKIRRIALLHGLLSFALNTFVVALTINLVAGLKK